MTEILVNIILIGGIVAVAISAMWFGFMLVVTIRDRYEDSYRFKQKHYDPYEYPERRKGK